MWKDLRLPGEITYANATDLGKQLGRKARHVYSHNGSVDPVAIARDLGFEVRKGSFSTEIVGGMSRSGELGKLIIVSENLNAKEKRFACSQLIGHYLHTRTSEVEDWIQKRDPLAGSERFPYEEIFAIEFARSLLVPGIYHKIARHSETVRDFIANRYSVPREVLAA